MPCHVGILHIHCLEHLTEWMNLVRHQEDLEQASFLLLEPSLYQLLSILHISASAQAGFGEKLMRFIDIESRYRSANKMKQVGNLHQVRGLQIDSVSQRRCLQHRKFLQYFCITLA